MLKLYLSHSRTDAFPHICKWNGKKVKKVTENSFNFTTSEIMLFQEEYVMSSLSVEEKKRKRKQIFQKINCDSTSLSLPSQPGCLLNASLHHERGHVYSPSVKLMEFSHSRLTEFSHCGGTQNWPAIRQEEERKEVWRLKGRSKQDRKKKPGNCKEEGCV